MANEEQDKTPAGEESTGFGEAFSERADNPAGERPEAGHEAEARAPATNEPAAAGSEPAPAPAAAGDTSGTSAEAFDPWAGMTPEQKSHFERIAASERSQRGRVGALTKKLSSYAAPATREAAPQGQDGEAEQQSGDGQAPDLGARLKQVAEEYGDVNGPVVEAIESMRTELAGLKASATRHEVDADAQRMTEAYTQLEAAHPDASSYGEHNPQFMAWYNEQPDGVKALAGSFDPRETSLALTLFKTEHGLAQAAGGQSGQTGSTAQGDRRARQLEGSRAVSSSGVPVAAGVPNDFSSGFHARAASAQKGR